MHKSFIKVVTWNINGLRSAWDDFVDFLETEKPDIVCLQEIKVDDLRLPEKYRKIGDYNSHWFHAQKPGYSGVAIYYKQAPNKILLGIGVEDIDREGRVITADFNHFKLVNIYFPNSGRDLSRLSFKLKFNSVIEKFLNKLKGDDVIACGDFNVAHREIDIARPKDNKKNAGFTEIERTWFDNFLKKGWVDTYRLLNPDKQEFSWWSNFYNARERNIGWRIDYHVVSPGMVKKLSKCEIKTSVMGSDHAPVILEFYANK